MLKINSDNVRKIVTIIVGIGLLGLTALGIYVAFQVTNNQAPLDSAAATSCESSCVTCSNVCTTTNVCNEVVVGTRNDCKQVQVGSERVCDQVCNTVQECKDVKTGTKRVCEKKQTGKDSKGNPIYQQVCKDEPVYQKVCNDVKKCQQGNCTDKPVYKEECTKVPVYEKKCEDVKKCNNVCKTDQECVRKCNEINPTCNNNNICDTQEKSLKDCNDCKTPVNPVCGDNICNGNETDKTCAKDCMPDKPAEEKCGNGYCSPAEKSGNSCSIDCGTIDLCGNKKCDGEENYNSCPADCPKSTITCGNGICEGGENNKNCSQDCKPKTGIGGGDVDAPDATGDYNPNYTGFYYQMIPSCSYNVKAVSCGGDIYIGTISQGANAGKACCASPTTFSCSTAPSNMVKCQLGCAGVDCSAYQPKQSVTMPVVDSCVGAPAGARTQCRSDNTQCYCENGVQTTNCPVTDYCIVKNNPGTYGNLVEGANCNPANAISNGEGGAFMGCSSSGQACVCRNGKLNCFMDTPDGYGYADSCPQPTPPAEEPITSGDTPGQIIIDDDDDDEVIVNPPSTPYCGDALCHAGEACERTSSGGNSYAACTSASGAAPTGSAVASCFGIELNQPDTTSTCQYCGDGVYTPGREQCDPTAPATGGNNPTQCNANCTFQPSVNQCIDLTENGVDPLRAGTGNYIIYTLVYQHASTTNPYPNIRLRVGPAGTPVGRDANNTGSVLVAPIPGTGYAYDSVTSRHTYRFRWEAASTGGSAVANGTYDVRVILDGTSEISTPSACTETIQVQSTAEQQPLFSIIKQSAPVCVADGSVQINYGLTVTNIGPVQGVIDFVRDELDSEISSAGITPVNITPSFGTYANGVITWTGTVGDRTFSAGQSKQYSYRITIPQSQVINFIASGVYNQALVQFDTTTTTDNTDSYDVRTLINCSIPGGSIPNTGIFDDGRFLLIGLIFTILGIFIYRADITKKVTRPLEIRR